MLASLADTFKSPVLGTQSLGQQARHQLSRMPRAASNAKRHQGARPSDLSPLSSVSSAVAAPNGSILPSPSGSSSSHAGSRRNHHAKNSKSNGHVTISSNGSLASSHASDVASVNGHIHKDSCPEAPALVANGFHKHHHIHHVAAADLGRRDSLGSSSVSSSSTAESFTSQSSIHISDDSHRRIDISSVKNPDIHRDPGPVGSIMTVVSSRPAWDTVALLVVLTQFSPLFLSFTYMAFTFLTYAPPTTITRFNSLSIATVKEVLQVSSFPLSIITMVLVDAVIFLVWLFLWDWMQVLVLDLSKMVIAVTLGGGAGAGGGGWRSVILCLFCILLSHFSSFDPISAWLRRVMGRWWVWVGPSPSSHHTPFSQLSTKGQIARGIMTLLAIHTFTQGLMRYVRGLLIRSQKREAQHLSIPDPEAGKLFSENSSNDPSVSSATSDADATAASASIQPTSSATSARKKRKRHIIVRLKQPLWSAIASTKIVNAKEMELSNQQELGKGAKKSDSGIVDSAPFLEKEGLIWLVHVDSEEAFFSTSYFPDYPPSDIPIVDTDNPDSSNLIDQTKPFYVRVNNAVWPSVRMFPIKEAGVDEGDDEAHDVPAQEAKTSCSGTRWTGKIPGLPSSSNFNCEFISTHTGEVITTIGFRTRLAATSQADPVVNPGQPPISQRPESPVTTLKNSLKKAEAKYDEQRTILNNTKKTNQAKIKAARKELERLNNSIASAGNNDAKYKNKVQTSAHQKQVWEEQANEYESELKAIHENTKSLGKELAEVEALFKKVQEKHDRSQAELKVFKTEREHEISQLESEESSLMNKRTKVAARLSRMERDLEKELTLNKERATMQEKMKLEIEAIETNSRNMIAQWQSKMQKQTEENRFLSQQLQHLQHAQSFPDFAGQYMGHQGFEHSPFGDHVSSGRPNTAAPQYNPPTLRSMNPTAPSFNPNLNLWPQIPSTMAPGWGAIGTAAPAGVVITQAPLTRGRSSSMMSNASGHSRLSESGETVATESTIGIPQMGSASGPPPGFSSQPLPFPQAQFVSPPQSRFRPGFQSIQRTDTIGSSGSGTGPGSP